MHTRTVIGTGSLLVAAAIALAAGATRAQDDGQAKRARLVIEKRTVSFGRQRNTEPATAEFAIVNRGDDTLYVWPTESDCPCMASSIRTEKLEIAPGERETLTATLSLEGRRGFVRETLSLETSDPDTPGLTLTMEGTAIAPDQPADEASVPPNEQHMTAKPVAGGQGLVCPEPVHDFGQADSTRTIVAEFSLRNTGPEPVRIGKVMSSCGCMSAEISDTELDVGEAATVRTDISLLGRHGPVNERVMVLVTEPERRHIPLRIRGTAVERVDINPHMVHFGRVLIDEGKERRVEVRFIDPEAVLRIESVACDAEFLAAEVEPRGERPAEGYTITVRTKPPLPAGPFETTLRIRTDRDTSPEIAIPMAGLGVGPLAFSPDHILLVIGNDAEATVTRDIYVTGGQVEEFAILGVRPPAEGVRVELSEMPSGGYRVQLHGLPVHEDLDGKVVRIETDVEAMPEIRVPIEVVRPDR